MKRWSQSTRQLHSSGHLDSTLQSAAKKPSCPEVYQGETGQETKTEGRLLGLDLPGKWRSLSQVED